MHLNYSLKQKHGHCISNGVIMNIISEMQVLAEQYSYKECGIPSFTKGKKQLSGAEVEMSRKLAHVRIHMERVMGHLRKFLILGTVILYQLLTY